MSDLQCPARFLLVCEPEASTAEALRHDRVAAVYDGAPGPGGAALARALGLPVQVLARPIALVDVLGRTPEALGALESLADLHRGETAVVTVVGRAGSRAELCADGDGVRLAEVSPEVER